MALFNVDILLAKFSHADKLLRLPIHETVNEIVASEDEMIVHWPQDSETAITIQDTNFVSRPC
jgi:hypothetical protein